MKIEIDVKQFAQYIKLVLLMELTFPIKPATNTSKLCYNLEYFQLNTLQLYPSRVIK